MMGRAGGREISCGRAGKTPTDTGASHLVGNVTMPARESVCNTPTVTTKMMTKRIGVLTSLDLGSDSGAMALNEVG
jgi:hypothetical protein